MAKVYYQKDAQMKVLIEKKVAVLGYGSQGHAHALNLRDSGCEVRIGLEGGRQGAAKAAADGFMVMPVDQAVEWADVIMVLVPDEIQPGLYETDILPGLSGRKLLLFAHGFSIHFGFIVPPAHVDVALVAPKSPGHMVRREFSEGRGVPGLVAIHQDASGQCQDLAVAYAHAIGLTRAGLIETTFREETETDLFGEQAVLCGGVTSLMRMGFETLVTAGYQPEMAYFECIHEMKLIVDMIYEGGFSWMRHSISNTAEYGDYITQEKMASTGIAEKMQTVLNDICSGDFARNWMKEQAAGGEHFQGLRRRFAGHQLEAVGRELRTMMPWMAAQKHENPEEVPRAK